MIGRLLRQFFMKPVELYKSRNIEVDNVESIGIILGPYRNLTTLTAGIMALHPNCQVLNHAGMRILQWNSLNFIKNSKPEVVERFKKYAIYISGHGQRGDYGGSITYSHAFTYPQMANKYKKRFGDKLIKDNINSVFWKESLRIANLIKKNNIDISELLSKLPEIKFMTPVRNPLDCAKSNMKTGKTEIFDDLQEEAEAQQTVSAILDEYKWFMDLKKKNPDNFFYFMQHNFKGKMLQALAQFLKIAPDEKWIEDALDVYEMKSSYQHSRELIEHFKTEIDKKFTEHPEFADDLLKFVE